MSAFDDAELAVGEAAAAIDGSITTPIRGASLFYALYYLAEIEDIDAAAFDFQQIRDEYHEAFFWYGIFSVARELSHLDDAYFIDGFTPAKYYGSHEVAVIDDPLAWLDSWPGPADERRPAPSASDVPQLDGVVTVRLDPETAQEHARSRVDDDIEGMAVEIFGDAFELAEARVADRVRFLDLVEEFFNGVTEPDPFLRTARQIFSRTSAFAFELERLTRGLPPRIRELDDKGLISRNALRVMTRASGWQAGFNGQGWASIPAYLRDRQSIPKTAWVDMGWGIEHNNQQWMDKARPFADKDRRVVAEEVPGVVPGGRDLPPDVAVSDVLVNLLDDAQEGNIDRIFDFAVHWDNEVGISLRRWRHRLGI